MTIAFPRRPHNSTCSVSYKRASTCSYGIYRLRSTITTIVTGWPLASTTTQKQGQLRRLAVFSWVAIRLPTLAPLHPVLTTEASLPLGPPWFHWTNKLARRYIPSPIDPTLVTGGRATDKAQELARPNTQRSTTSKPPNCQRQVSETRPQGPHHVPLSRASWVRIAPGRSILYLEIKRRGLDLALGALGHYYCDRRHNPTR